MIWTALAALLVIAGLAALVCAAIAICYPFALIAKAADDRIAAHFAVHRRLGL
jgi:hypothetical protein